jgi:very-short-patch-repair endonuclease
VAGDDKQLPPTTFFQAGADFEDETDEGFEEPLESVLDECLALPGFRKVFLKWHYRSKREELIDFSNKKFYDGGLVTFPSPDSQGAQPAVELHLVDDGVYDRGGSRKNLKEASKVCDLVEDHFRQHGSGSSLGVIALSMAQEEAIQDEFDRRKVLDPDLSAQSEANVEEPFFVKALERVQGDERDRIIISLGYGKDANGVLTMNFGPINKGGGERRLNVAITRAREKVILVSSFRPQDMDLTRLSTSSLGVRILAEYLEYASRGGRFPVQTYGGGEPESDFEYDVRERLAARGLKVDAQVGCSGFRIDLAIRHPRHDDRYVLGVECDGATYHTQRSARDRDKLRQAVLEKLGWKIYRVWSTDWVKNPDLIAAEISNKVQDLLEQNGVQVARPTESNSETVGSMVTSQGTGLVDDSSPSRLTSSQDHQPCPSYGFDTYLEYRSLGGRPNDVQSLIQAIAQKESPIHVDALVRRVAMAYGIPRVGSRTKRNIWSHIQQSYARRKILMRGNFCWVGNTVTPRAPKRGEQPRPIDEIALEELEAAARVIVAKEKGIPRESLIRTVGQALGYGRIGAKVDQRIDLAIEQQFKKGQFSNYEGQVILTPRSEGYEPGR